MSAAVPQADRRTHARLACKGLAVTLRVRGQWFNRPASAIDFSSDGMAVLWPQPLAKDRTVFLNIACGSEVVEDLVGVVHNCTPHPEGYRLGILFRADSSLQLDSSLVRERLQSLASRLFAGQSDAPPLVDAVNSTSASALSAR